MTGAIWWELQGAFRKALASGDQAPTEVPGTSVPVRTFLRDVGTRKRAQLIVTEILDDEPLLDAVAARSYRHALGFDKFILLSERPFGQLRLHLWSSADARRREHVHNHRFHFVSVVLVGRLTAHLYVPMTSGEAHRHYTESAAPEDRQWTFTEHEPLNLEPAMLVELPVGGCHEVGPAALHRVEVPPGEDVVTLLVEGPSTQDSSSVLVPVGQELPEDSGQRRFTRQEARLRLEYVRTLLSS